jgi:hypothetical protein
MSESKKKTVTRIQMAPVIDHISDDFEHVGSRLPYPFYVDEKGYVQLQDFWQGAVYRIIGFQNRVDVQTIDLWWNSVTDPEQIVGKYLVVSDKAGTWATYPTAAVKAERVEAVL